MRNLLLLRENVPWRLGKRKFLPLQGKRSPATKKKGKARVEVFLSLVGELHPSKSQGESEVREGNSGARGGKNRPKKKGQPRGTFKWGIYRNVDRKKKTPLPGGGGGRG